MLKVTSEYIKVFIISEFLKGQFFFNCKDSLNGYQYLTKNKICYFFYVIKDQ